MINLAKRRDADLLFVGRELLGLSVHFFGRSFPCVGPDVCPGCVYAPARPFWYAHVLTSAGLDVVELNLSGFEAAVMAMDSLQREDFYGLQMVMRRKTARGKWVLDKVRIPDSLPKPRPADSLLLAVAGIYYLPMPPSARNTKDLVEANKSNIMARLRRAIGILPGVGVDAAS